MHYPQPPQPNMDNKSDNKEKQYNLRGIQVHRSCGMYIKMTRKLKNYKSYDKIHNFMNPRFFLI